MNILKYPADLSFVDNPMQFLVEVASAAVVELYIAIKYLENGEIKQYETGSFRYYPYKTGNNSHHVQFDIGAILKQFAQRLHKRDTSVLSPGSNDIFQNGAMYYQVMFSDSTYFDGYAVKGGISNTMFQNFSEQSTDVFENIICNPDAIFLLTSRIRQNNIITFRKSELQEVAFFHVNNKNYSLRANGSNYDLNDPLQTGGPSGNLTTGIFYFFNLAHAYNVLAPTGGRMRMFVDNIPVFEINVLDDGNTEERYILEFINSLGFKEKFLITGEAGENSQFAEAESYKIIESGFVKKQFFRGKYTEKITVSTGHRLKCELEFLKDLLLSEDVFFIDLESEERRPCHVTAEPAWQRLQNAPQSVMLTIDFMNEENKFFAEEILTDVLKTNDGENLITNNNNLQIISN